MAYNPGQNAGGSLSSFQNPGSLAAKDSQVSTDNEPVAGLFSSLAISTSEAQHGTGAVKSSVSAGEKFNVAAATGTMALSLPVSTSSGRGGNGPALSLAYDSSSGNGPFGIGWTLSTDRITRKTINAIPTYDDSSDGSDTFTLSSVGDLVPWLDETSSSPSPSPPDSVGAQFAVRKYRPRVESTILRIEHWVHQAQAQLSHWRSISSSNVVTLYGTDQMSRVSENKGDAQSSAEEKVFAWLVAESFDDRGNHIVYSYKAENADNVDIERECERHRSSLIRTRQRYLKSIRYGNRSPNRNMQSWELIPNIAASAPGDWLFEIVLDYGEHDDLSPSTEEVKSWTARADSFSTRNAGFEIRDYRICKRILMFHHLPEELGRSDCLVSSTILEYNESSGGSYLTSCHTAYHMRKDSSEYFTQSMPPVQMDYARLSILEDANVYEIDISQLVEIPDIVNSKSQWIDLNGEGAPGILVRTNQSGWYYQRNECAAKDDVSVAGFGPLEQLSQLPAQDLLGKTGYFEDLQGEGHLDFVLTEADYGISGFSQRTEDGQWTNVVPFRQPPAFSIKNPDLVRIDLTGSGLHDVLASISDTGETIWFPSLGNVGFGAECRMQQNTDLPQPQLLSSDSQEGIFTCDMTGDGLTDIVRVRYSSIVYWPNLGYGKFGGMITMDNCPMLDRIEAFTPQRLRLVDIDGSGATDLLYLPESGGLHVYNNYYGNSWSDKQLITTFPKLDSFASVSCLDLLGRGTQCICWMSMNAAGEQCLKYIDLSDGQRPHLLTRYTNGLGLETKIEYCPSTKYFLQDERAGSPWMTKLPYPVLCIDRTVMMDHVAQTTFVTSYAYHDGYFDSFDREFRGFAMVEQWDAERYTSDTTNVAGRYLRPPTHVKSWFHTGSPNSKGILSKVFDRQQLPSSKTPSNLDGEAQHDAVSTLKGARLRQEMYCDDGRPESRTPYLIQEQSHEVSLMQRKEGRARAVFRIDQRESLTCTLERESQDRRLQHDLNLDFDKYGQVTKAASVSYGCAASTLQDAADRERQQETIFTYSETTYTNDINVPDKFRSSAPATSQQYRIFWPRDVTIFQLDHLLDDDFAFFRNAEVMDGLNIIHKSDTTQKLLLGQSRTYYNNEKLDDVLPLGKIEALSTQFQTHSLAFTKDMLKDLFKRDNTTLLAEADVSSVMKAAGYVNLDGDGNWWTTCERSYFSFDGSDELSAARSNFYMPTRIVDPWNNAVVQQLDKWKLFPIRTTDSLENTVVVSFDYASQRPVERTDANGNRQRLLLDAMGNPTAFAYVGKASDKVTDSLDGLNPFVTESDLNEFLNEPTGALAISLLGNATVRKIRHISRYHETQKAGKPSLPAFEAIISRNRSNNAWSNTGRASICVMISYLDGYGRAIQNATLDDQRDNEQQWLTSGWSDLNNKGQVLALYNPVFSPRPDFKFRPDPTSNTKTTILYDAIGREVGKLYPDHTWEKIHIEQWSTTTYDNGDTVLLDSPTKDPVVGASFQGLDPSTYSPTWYATMKSGSMLEQDAARKAEAYANTPAIAHLDAQGRTIVAVVDNGSTQYTSRTLYDDFGRVAKQIDPMGRTASELRYDMLSRCAYSASMESGRRWTLLDVIGRPVMEWNDRDMRTRVQRDQLGRTTALYVKKGSDHEIMVEQTVYGEQAADATANNLRGQTYRSFDQAGCKTNVSFDFRGNLNQAVVRLAKDYRTDIDWSHPSDDALDENKYTSSWRYDSHDKVISATDASGNVTEYTHSTTGNILRIRFAQASDLTSWETPVVSTSYDAHGLPLTIRYGNGSKANHEYDPQSLRLARRSISRDSGAVLQDLTFTYDCCGKVVHVSDTALQDLYFRNAKIQPASSFTYDPCGRLLDATGREQFRADNGNLSLRSDMSKSPMGQEISPGDGSQLCQYRESYAYDVAGNISSVKHEAVSHPEIAGWTRAYQYSEPSCLDLHIFSNRLSATKTGSTTDLYGYDEDAGRHGCITSMPGYSVLVWNYNDKLKASAKQRVNNGSPETTWFVYDASGERIRKVTERQSADGRPGTKLKETIYLPSCEIYRTFAGDGTTVILERKTSEIKSSSTVALWELDNSGRRLVRYQYDGDIELDDRAQLVSYEEYTPFGTTTYRACRKDIEAPSKYRYANYERDSETGLDHCNARYYASWLGRWISPDPIGTADGLNLYRYAGNDPVNFVDPGGMMFHVKGLLSMMKGYSAFKATVSYSKGTALTPSAMGYSLRASFSTSNKNEFLIAGQNFNPRNLPMVVTNINVSGKRYMTPIKRGSNSGAVTRDTSYMDGMVSSGDRIAQKDFDWQNSGEYIKLYRGYGPSDPRPAQLMKDNHPDAYIYDGGFAEKFYPGAAAGNFNKMTEENVAYFTPDFEFAKQMWARNGGTVVEFWVKKSDLNSPEFKKYSYGPVPTEQLRKDVIENKHSQLYKDTKDPVRIETRSQGVQAADWLEGPIAHAPLLRFKDLSIGWNELSSDTRMSWARYVKGSDGEAKLTTKWDANEPTLYYSSQVMVKGKGLNLFRNGPKILHKISS